MLNEFGALSSDNFLNLLAHKSRACSVFRGIDVQGKGFISGLQLRQAMISLRYEESHVDEMFYEFNISNLTARVDYETFSCKIVAKIKHLRF